MFRMQREVRARTDRAWGEATATIWRGELRATGYARSPGSWSSPPPTWWPPCWSCTTPWPGTAAPGTWSSAIALAAQVNVQVTAAVTLLQELQRLARTLQNLRWLRELTARQAPPPRGSAAAGTDPGGDPAARGVVPLPRHRPAGARRRRPAPARRLHVVALVGDNGAGKTTLVKLLCRFYEPTTRRDHRGRRRPAPLRPRRSGAAGSPPDSRTSSGSSCRAADRRGRRPAPGRRDRSGAAPRSSRRRRRRRRRPAPTASTPSSAPATPPGRELSGGQWQKLALGRAMMRESPLLVVLDEPTSALDAQAEHAAVRALRRPRGPARGRDRRRSRCWSRTGSRPSGWPT